MGQFHSPPRHEETLQAAVAENTAKEAIIFADENHAYLWLESEEEVRERKAVDRSEWGFEAPKRAWLPSVGGSC